MRRVIATTLLLFLMSMGLGSSVNAQVSFSIRIGPPPPPRVVHVVPPPPGPSFVWIEGYWYPVATHYAWHNGYWTRAPYEGAYWVRPRYDGQRYYAGYWAGGRGRVEHDHRWDGTKERDFEHSHGRARGHG